MRKDYRRRLGNKPSGSHIVIYPEGDVTEQEYIKALRNHLRIAKELVEIRKTTYTDLPSLIYAIKKEQVRGRRGSERARVDQWWIVADTEGKDISKQLIQDAEKSGIRFALSAPSFEYWLRLHFAYTTQHYSSAHDVISDLRKDLPGFSAANKYPDMSRLLPNIAIAVENAEKVRNHCAEVGSTQPFTDFDLLVHEINKQAKSDRRLML